MLNILKIKDLFNRLVNYLRTQLCLAYKNEI